MSNDENERNFEILTLSQIASWCLDSELWANNKENDDGAWADLPPIQRGFVWNANQIERLWDSIASGFPLGSLMLQALSGAPQVSRRCGSFLGADAGKRLAGQRNYFLLDGQQRATSIALGFKNWWDTKEQSGLEDWRALWVDIAAKPDDDRAFLFRMTSKAHPWGYSSRSAANSPPSRIAAEKMRAALLVYQSLSRQAGCASDETKLVKPYEVCPHIAIPWDAQAPIPVSFILECLIKEQSSDNAALAAALLEKMKVLSVWRLCQQTVGERGQGGNSTMEKTSEALKEAAKKWTAVAAVLKNESDCAVFADLVAGLRGALERTKIPAPVLRSRQMVGGSGRVPEENHNVKNEHDPAFKLFERINTAGTRLTPEEINYSMLKGVWEKAAEIMDELLQERKLTHPARLASLLSRLVLTMESNNAAKQPDATESDKAGKGLQATLGIDQFRREIWGTSNRWKGTDSSLKERLETLHCSGRAASILQATWELLTADDWALPPVLAAEITGRNEDLRNI